MISRPMANNKRFKPLLDLIEQRFDLFLPNDINNLKSICEHYSRKREMLLWEHGESVALKMEDYSKAVLISETARLILREIDPFPRRKKIKRKK